MDVQVRMAHHFACSSRFGGIEDAGSRVRQRADAWRVPLQRREDSEGMKRRIDADMV
jgi:hypothetical protein